MDEIHYKRIKDAANRLALRQSKLTDLQCEQAILKIIASNHIRLLTFSDGRPDEVVYNPVCPLCKQHTPD
jgi:hypothetical protein